MSKQKLHVFCVYHADCTDGLTAASIIHKMAETLLPSRNEDEEVVNRLENYFPFDHGKTTIHKLLVHLKRLDENDKAILYVVDYFLPHSEIKKIKAVFPNTYVIVIDHHKTAIDLYNKEVETIENHHFDQSVEYILNSDHSGAVLTYKTFFSDDVPMFYKLIEDRDLFTYRYDGDTDCFRYGFLNQFKSLDDLVAYDVNSDAHLYLIDLGRPLYDKHQESVKRVAEQAIETRIIYFDEEGNKKECAGHIVNCPEELVSDVGSRLYSETHPIAIMYSMTKDGVWKVGLRSHKSVDCSSIAKFYGGGGHAQACACRVEHRVFIEDFLYRIGYLNFTRHESYARRYDALNERWKRDEERLKEQRGNWTRR